MKRILLATLAVAALAGSALAADLPSMPAPIYKAAYFPVWSWTGFYIGVNAGGLWSNNSKTLVGTPGPCSAALPDCTAVPNYSSLMATAINQIPGANRQVSFLSGGQIGYNWQVNRAVFGIEADIQSAPSNSNTSGGVIITPSPAFPALPLSTTFNDTQRLNYLGTVRGRAGFLATPTFLVYVTGGFAYGGINSTTAITQMIALPDPSIPAFATGGGTTTRVGGTVGGGVEWGFLWTNWSAKAEYLYYNLGTNTYTLPLAIVSVAVPGAVAGSATATVSNRFSGSIARVGLNYRFGYERVAPRGYY
jgi:outer membrane immunogenic protein